ncbi:TetR family transcriptional regulator, partial [Achromobacter xylosoxidans]
GISKPMLYVHFGDKEALFDAVLSREILGAAQDERFDVSDLAGYAGRTYDLLAHRPHFWRLMTWLHLERGQDVLLHPAGHNILEAKHAAIAAERARGHITADFSPEEIVRLVTTLVQSWYMAPPAKDVQQHEARRQMIQAAVAPQYLPKPKAFRHSETADSSCGICAQRKLHTTVTNEVRQASFVLSRVLASSSSRAIIRTDPKAP